VAVFRGGEVLLIQRGKGLYKGLWSLPGGAIQWGEKAADAARRELEEETGLLALNLALGDVADAIFRESGGAVSAHFTIAVFATRDVSGALAAGSDASGAGYFGRDARLRLACTPGLETAIENARLALEKSGQ
jgi:ADP-ribose pyrophosphatase YjhB (NUDIX family)